MIENEKQYEITKKKLQGIREQNERLKSQGEYLSVKGKLILASRMDVQEELEMEIAAYERSINT